jgi:hypothetical protein
MDRKAASALTTHNLSIENVCDLETAGATVRRPHSWLVGSAVYSAPGVSSGKKRPWKS